ncbi:MAG TPA: hypothetical protein VJM08_12280 [Anaerolineales bacterium]|nr:hypothetical protein [Anaerolineales bacterium]
MANRNLLLIVILLLTACAPQQPAPTMQTSEPTSVPSPTLAPTEIPTQVIALATEPFKPVQDALLPPGTYTSEKFVTPLTYTVPAGWVMYDDEPGQFELALENQDPYIYVWRDVRAVGLNCSEEPHPDVRASAADMAEWLATREGLDTSEPQPVNIGGLRGYMIDVHMSPDWTKACPFSDGEPTVPIITGTAPLSEHVFWGVTKDSSQRYYFLDLGENGSDENLVVTVEVCCGANWDEVMETVSPVIDSFVFAP